MLRIGSMDYEPSEAVRPHTLDQRMVETLNAGQMYDNQKKQGHVGVLLNLLKEGKPLKLEEPQVSAALSSLISPNLKKQRQFLGKP